MKKVLILFLCLFTLTSCWKTKFENLPIEKQEEITNYYLWKVSPILWEMITIAFDFDLSEEEKDKKWDELVEKAKKIFENDLKKQYSNVEFWTYEEWNEETNKVDNSREEQNILQTENIREYTSVPFWDFYEFDKWDDEKIKIKVNDIVWKWTKIEHQYLVYTAKSEFLLIRLEAENIWKKPTWKWLWDVKLITKDWYEFSSSDTIQNPENLKDWYSGCISCEMNPMEKAEQWIVFDLQKIDLAWAKLRFEDDLVEFEL